ncbi:hypothetical protein D3C87_182270 [compost metagenome]
MMEGIETVDAILSQEYPKTTFEAKDKVKAERTYIAIRKFKINRLEQVLVPVSPVSLIICPTEKL